MSSDAQASLRTVRRRVFAASFWDTRRFEDILAAFSFSKIEKRVIKERAEWTVEQIIGRLYSTSFARREFFGDRLEMFERELTNTLREQNPAGTFQDETSIEVLLAKK